MHYNKRCVSAPLRSKPPYHTLLYLRDTMNTQIFADVDNYIGELLATEDEALQQTIQSLHDNNIENISISASQGKLLQVFAAACGAKRILEVGTLVGYSTIWLARMLPDGGKLITLEYDERNAGLAKQNISIAGLAGKVEIRTGKAIDLMQEMVSDNEAPFDLVFIDADKLPYTEYFQLALQLSRPGTIIIADNVVREGRVMDDNSTDDKVRGVRRFNQYLSECNAVTATIFQTIGAKDHDGMAVAVVK